LTVGAKVVACCLFVFGINGQRASPTPTFCYFAPRPSTQNCSVACSWPHPFGCYPYSVCQSTLPWCGAAPHFLLTGKQAAVEQCEAPPLAHWQHSVWHFVHTLHPKVLCANPPTVPSLLTWLTVRQNHARPSRPTQNSTSMHTAHVWRRMRSNFIH
jgi:hypothetical protein